MRKNKILSLLVIFFSILTGGFAQKKLVGFSNTGPLIINPENKPMERVSGKVPTNEEKVKPVIAILSDYTKPQKTNHFVLKMKVTDNTEVRIVTVNKNIAEKNNDFYQITLNLTQQKNEFTIKAIDKFWNETVKKITIYRESRFARNGKDRALLFAVDNYDNNKKLYKPIADALRLKQKLENSYGFKVELIKDPDLKTIRDKLIEYRDKYNTNKLDRSGQLLIFFSGHGDIGDKTGFFVPKDGKSSNKYSTCFQYNEMREMIAKIDVKHKLLMVDACFSAYLNPYFDKADPVYPPGKLSPLEIEMNRHKQNPSFEYITSDAVGSTTPDNSQLMAKFLEALTYSDTSEGIVKLSVLVPKYLKLAKPQPYYDRFEKDLEKTSFIFFKK